eukprot:COSAG06_NODE_57471_length_280_cov_0.690608_1_plen_55_part_01
MAQKARFLTCRPAPQPETDTNVLSTKEMLCIPSEPSRNGPAENAVSYRLLFRQLF